MNEELEKRRDLEAQLDAKNSEIEILKEYKRKNEAEQENLRISGGYEEAIRPLRTNSKEKSKDEEDSKSSAIKDQIISKMQE